MKLFFQLGLLALLALSVEPRRRRGKRAVEELSVFEPQWLAARGRGARGRGRVIRQYVERQGGIFIILLWQYCNSTVLTRILIVNLV